MNDTQDKDGRNGADLLVDTLIAWGIDIVFGMPGDGINGVMEALRKRQDRIRFILVRHEEAAAFMACAMPSGPVGWAAAWRRPVRRRAPAERPLRRQVRPRAGARDHRPAVPRPGRHVHPAGRRSRPSVPGRRGVQRPHHGRGAGQHASTLACRTALARRGVAHLAIPIDVQEQKVEDDEPSPRNVAAPRVVAPPTRRAAPERSSAPRNC